MDVAAMSGEALVDGLRARLDRRSIVLVGMMGAGKSSIGRRLGRRLGLPFIDADSEIERVTRMTIPEIFDAWGEPAFRDGERRVIIRLLGDGPQVLATGGGAFMDGETRAAIRANGLSVWLRADADVLMRRVRRRADRPLLRTADPEGTLRRLVAEREPVYALADLAVLSHDAPHEVTVEGLLAALTDRLAAPGEAEGWC